MAKKGGLGRGLDILFQDTGAGGGDEGVSTLRLAEIEPDKNQPRKAFDDTALSELAASITEHGVLQPIVVRPSPAGGYIIVAGERRWRAARLAGLTEIPALIKDISDTQAMEIALIENLQREDLDPVEEAWDTVSSWNGAAIRRKRPQHGFPKAAARWQTVFAF